MGKHRSQAAWLSLLLLAVLATSSSWAFAQSITTAGTPADTGGFSPAYRSIQRQAAQAGLAAWAQRASASTSASASASSAGSGIDRIFGAGADRALSHAAIGDGFEIFLVDPRALLSGKHLAQSVYGSGEWRFVVVANGKGIGLITVAVMNGKWTMVEAGAHDLAGEIAPIAQRYEQRLPNARLRFVRSPQAVADFIEVSAPGSDDAASAPVYVPLASARAMLAPAEAHLLAPDAALSDAQLHAALRQRVQRGMRDPRFGH